jgi:muramoyltetrapeptide carboxypeptidase
MATKTTSGENMKIGVMAPATPLDPAVAEQVKNLVAERYDPAQLEVVFHPQCFLAERHFAGPDDTRADAFVEMANSDEFDCLWFARGGYGGCRVTDKIFGKLGPEAGRKTYMGYSDMGFLLAGLYARDIGRPVHGPMPVDITREGGEGAVVRALDFLLSGADAGLESTAMSGTPSVAFNITVLSQLLGTDLEPDLTAHVIILEDVGEYLYRLDRFLFHITSNPSIRRAAGFKLGRCSDILENDRPFGLSMDEIMAHWCQASGVPFLGAADIGHDSANKIVPFGAFQVDTA